MAEKNAYFRLMVRQKQRQLRRWEERPWWAFTLMIGELLNRSLLLYTKDRTIAELRSHVVALEQQVAREKQRRMWAETQKFESVFQPGATN